MDLDALKADLVRDEGQRLSPYTDTAGKLTIGIGHNLTDRGISQAVCDAIFAEDIATVISDLDRELPWWTRLDEPRQRVLANMAFNLGIAKLLLFRHTLDAMARGDYGAAADGMAASLWASQVGPRAQRLIAVMRGE
jgi:lysozyme